MPGLRGLHTLSQQRSKLSAQRHYRFSLHAYAIRFGAAICHGCHTRHPYRIIAPQHGSVIHTAQDIVYIRETLAALSGVGIDGILQKEKACAIKGKLS